MCYQLLGCVICKTNSELWRVHRRVAARLEGRNLSIPGVSLGGRLNGAIPIRGEGRAVLPALSAERFSIAQE